MQQINNTLSKNKILKIPGEIVRVMKLVKGYLVGGPVRDILLGLTPHDFDIASPYTPDEVEDILHRAGIPTYEVGKRFGTVGAIVGKYKVEITTFRKETYDFVSRKPKVVFAKNIAEDLARRDFTINAMAMGPDGSIVDPFHGVEDLRRGIIRFVGNPEHRILEDPLRILRALRFAARFGFKIDESSIRAIVKLSPELRRISKERIKDELYKAAQTPRFTLYIVLNDKYGLFKFYGPTWEEIIAKMHKIRHSKRGYHYGETVWQHTIDVLSRMDNWGYPCQLKIAGLTHDVGKVETATVKKGVVHFYEHEKVGVDIAIKMLRELKASGKMMKYVAFIVRYHMKIGTAIAYYKSGKFKPMARLVGEVILSGQRQWLYDLILMHRADANTEIPDGLWVALDDIMKLKRPAFPKELLNRIPPEQRKAYLYGRIVEEAIRILKGAH